MLGYRLVEQRAFGVAWVVELGLAQGIGDDQRQAARVDLVAGGVAQRVGVRQQVAAFYLNR